MTSRLSLTRRSFLASTGLLTAAGWSSLASGQAPSESVRVGVIGTGVRGKYLIGNLPDAAKVVAICDCAQSRMSSTLSPERQFKAVLERFVGRDASGVKRYQDYQQLIDRRDLDAVIVATPDHHHAQAALLALQAGLDVYLEKPLATTIDEGRRLVDAVRKTGRVLQVGSQQRTMEMNQFGCEFIRDGGLGKISHVELPNYPGPIGKPEFPQEPVPSGLAWNEFLGPTPVRSHNRKLWMKEDFRVGDLLWRGWDLFRDYSGHLMTNWGAHSVDMVQYALGMDDSGPVKIIPDRSVSSKLLEQDWQSKWDIKTPYPVTSWEEASRFKPVTLEYANGVKLHLRPGVYGAIFHGEKGKALISRNRFETNPKSLVTNSPDESVLEKWEGSGHVARPHLQNWLDAIKSGSKLNAPVEVGHRTVTVCHLVNITRELNRPLMWDPVKEEFPGDVEANGLLSRPRRKGFELPVI